MRRLLVMLGAVATVLMTALPAQAGNWAVTELDPLPATIKPNVAYTVGYWVLQHGTHPFAGSPKDFGPTGLRLTGENGKVLTFTGTPLPEPAHYAVSIRVPAGTWRVQGVQGIFSPYELGRLAVPGTLTPAPPQFPGTSSMEIVDYWGAIKPPGFPWKGTPASLHVGDRTSAPAEAAIVPAGTPGDTAQGDTAQGDTAQEDTAPGDEETLLPGVGPDDLFTDPSSPDMSTLITVGFAVIATLAVVSLIARAVSGHRTSRSPFTLDGRTPPPCRGDDTDPDAGDTIHLGRDD